MGVAMPGIVAAVVKYLSSMSEDYADLFCELFDRLDPAEFHAEGEAWMADADVAATAAGVEQAALDGRARRGARRRASRPSPPARPRRRTRPRQPAVRRSRRRRPSPSTRSATRRPGRLDSGALPGALLPRFARPGRRGQLPDDLADAFGSVVRVGSADWDACDHAALPARSRLTRP